MQDTLIQIWLYISLFHEVQNLMIELSWKVSDVADGVTESPGTVAPPGGTTVTEGGSTDADAGKSTSEETGRIQESILVTLVVHPMVMTSSGVGGVIAYADG